jgi:hypothetical protein
MHCLSGPFTVVGVTQGAYYGEAVVQGAGIEDSGKESTCESSARKGRDTREEGSGRDESRAGQVSREAGRESSASQETGSSKAVSHQAGSHQAGSQGSGEACGDEGKSGQGKSGQGISGQARGQASLRQESDPGQAGLETRSQTCLGKGTVQVRCEACGKISAGQGGGRKGPGRQGCGRKGAGSKGEHETRGEASGETRRQGTCKSGDQASGDEVGCRCRNQVHSEDWSCTQGQGSTGESLVQKVGQQQCRRPMSEHCAPHGAQQFARLWNCSVSVCSRVVSGIWAFKARAAREASGDVSLARSAAAASPTTGRPVARRIAERQLPLAMGRCAAGAMTRL